MATITCKCEFRTRLLGDGCAVCNPDMAEELARDPCPSCDGDDYDSSAEECSECGYGMEDDETVDNQG